MKSSVNFPVMDYDRLYRFVTAELEQKLPPYLTYHNVEHTKKVIEKAMYIAEKEGVSGKDLTLLKTAALLHDVGFIKGYLNHEASACEFAKNHLPNFNYSRKETGEICEMILATKIPQSPKNHLSEILCDADVSISAVMIMKGIPPVFFRSFCRTAY